MRIFKRFFERYINRHYVNDVYSDMIIRIIFCYQYMYLSKVKLNYTFYKFHNCFFSIKN